MQIGIDEVGRGSLAGPLVVGAVALKKEIRGLKDSKKLTPKERSKIAKEIIDKADATSLGWVWPHEIDDLGLTQAITLAITRALSLISGPIESIIIDGSYNFLHGNNLVTTLIGADNLIPAVSAASVIAKVARDNYMQSISSYWPLYDFSSHVGYGTKYHMEAINKNGPCAIHRLSFRPVTKES